MDQLISMEELLPLVQDRHLKHVLLEDILLLVPGTAQIVPVEHFLIVEQLNSVPLVRQGHFHLGAHHHALCVLLENILLEV